MILDYDDRHQYVILSPIELVEFTFPISSIQKPGGPSELPLPTHSLSLVP
ncbi:hypothetical protein ACYJ1Y_17160 [Natrialbaceae archaeon A-gly3]